MEVFREKLRQVKSHITSLYRKNEYPSLLFHNFFHTSEVVRHTDELLSHYQPSTGDAFATSVAAWFHDTGHLFSKMEGHEELSWKIAEEYLQPLNMEDSLLRKIQGCIMATKIPSHPECLIQQIICDADTYHLGTTEFLKTDPLLKEEMRLREHIDTIDWDRKTLDFLTKHRFHTDYCRLRLTAQKLINMAIVQSRINQSRT